MRWPAVARRASEVVFLLGARASREIKEGQEETGKIIRQWILQKVYWLEWQVGVWLRSPFFSYVIWVLWQLQQNNQAIKSQNEVHTRKPYKREKGSTEVVLFDKYYNDFPSSLFLLFSFPLFFFLFPSFILSLPLFYLNSTPQELPISWEEALRFTSTNFIVWHSQERSKWDTYSFSKDPWSK